MPPARRKVIRIRRREPVLEDGAAPAMMHSPSPSPTSSFPPAVLSPSFEGFEEETRRTSQVSLRIPVIHDGNPRRVPEPSSDPRLTAPVWQVWIEGGDPIGPVSADQIARGVRTGKVPSHASVKLEADTFWSDLLDVPDVVAALKVVSAESEPPPPSIAPGLVIRQYLVWVEGSDPVGPVSADQIARGIRAGKVPTHASIQRVGDLFASDVLDEPEVIAALKQI